MSMSLKFTGLPELRARFSGLREEVRGDLTRRAVREGAMVMKAAISAAAPILDHRTAESTAQQPGALKSGIEIRLSKDEFDFIQAEIGPKGELSHVAYWVEFGHFLVKGGYLSSKKGQLQGAGHRVGFIEPHPFIRPAAEESGSPAIERYAEVMTERLKGFGT